MANTNNGRDTAVGYVMMSLESHGCDFVRSALALNEAANKGINWSTNYVHSFSLLASQATELLLKSIIATRICLENNGKPTKEILLTINKKIKPLLHQLDKIFNEVPELKKALKISNIRKYNANVDKDLLVDEFRFTIELDGEQKEISIKNLEGARYGVLAAKKDLGGYSQINTKGVANFLEKLMDKTIKMRANIIQKFDQNNLKK